jgi:hypothetical protein
MLGRECRWIDRAAGDEEEHGELHIAILHEPGWR